MNLAKAESALKATDQEEQLDLPAQIKPRFQLLFRNHYKKLIKKPTAKAKSRQQSSTKPYGSILIKSRKKREKLTQ